MPATVWWDHATAPHGAGYEGGISTGKAAGVRARTHTRDGPSEPQVHATALPAHALGARGTYGSQGARAGPTLGPGRAGKERRGKKRAL